MFAMVQSGQDTTSRLHVPHDVTMEDIDHSPGGGAVDSVANWMGAGDFDWGGGNGVGGDGPAGNVVYQNRYAATDVNSNPQNEGAIGRVMNKLMFGAGMTGNESFDVFRCPGEEGWYKNATSVGPPGPVHVESSFKATGNSYMGDYFGYKDHYWDQINGQTYRRCRPHPPPPHKFV